MKRESKRMRILSQDAKESNKRRSRLHRQRKKDYILSLESRIKDLEGQVASLANELSKYQDFKITNISDQTKDETPNKKVLQQSFIFNESPASEDEKEEMEEKTIDYYFQLWENNGPGSFTRKSFIMSWFDNIIDHITSDDYKIQFSIFKDYNLEFKEKIYKLATMPKYLRVKLQEEWNMPEIHRILCDPGHVEVLKDWQSFDDISQRAYVQLKKCVHSLIEIRNKMLYVLKGMHEEIRDNFHVITPEQIERANVYRAKLRNPKFLHKNYIWDIPCDDRIESN